MTFLRVEPNEHYRDLRLTSEGGSWDLGLNAYASGMRVRMGVNGKPPKVLDFCIGQDTSLFAPALTSVLKRLEPLAESASPEEIDAVFPWAGTRPDMAVHLDALLSVLS